MEYLPIDQIQSSLDQPRTIFDPVEMSRLAESIVQYGILEPLLVTRGQHDGIYVLIAGERRLRAARQIGLELVPVVIRDPDMDDRQRLEIALIENIQRVDLNPMEKARAYQQLSEVYKLSHEEIAAKVSQHRSTVTNTLRLLKLPDRLQHALLTGSISERQASALLALYDLPEKLRQKAESYNYDPSLKPSNVEEKVMSGASSDYVRETINRMLLGFGKRLLWQLDTAFAVPAEMPACCGDCPNLVYRSGENLCADEDCYFVRLNAYNKQRLPLPEPSSPMPAPAPLAPKVNVEIKHFTLAGSDEPDEDETESEGSPSPSESVMAYSTMAPQPVAADTELALAPESPAAPQPPVSLVTAPAPAAPDWHHATLLITITYQPVDGHTDGRLAWVGLRANNGAPAIRMCREKDTLQPGYLANILLDMETKFKEL